MAYLDPNEAFQNFKERALEGIQSMFPLKGRTRTVRLTGFDVQDTLHPDDIRSQHKARVEESTWSVPVYGRLELLDNQTGKVLEKKQILLAELPKMTKRYSYIIGGQEFQIDSQWQLRPGAYVRRNQNNEIVTKFNVLDRNAFDLKLDPGSKTFSLIYNKSKVPLYPVLRAMGVGDEELRKTWGEEIFKANAEARGGSTALSRIFHSDKGAAPGSKQEAERHVVNLLSGARMRPDVTKTTLGKPLEFVNGEALHLATQKMLKVQAGHPEDDRDALVFKDLRGIGDFVVDKINRASRDITAKVRRQIDRPDARLRTIVRYDLFNKPVYQAFHKNQAARTASQINPVEMISSAFQTTVMGPGGIQSDQTVQNETKLINPSHLGYLDPIHTPESDRAGVNLRLPIGVKKVGREAHIPLYNLKTHKTELVPPGTFYSSNVVLPDQLEWKDGKPRPLHPTVKMSGVNNEVREGHFSEAQYAIRHPSVLFNMTSNLIPFLGNTSGNRASMASRHIEQAISLHEREAPHVQVSTGVTNPDFASFEKLLGRYSAHTSPVDGKVVAVRPDGVLVKDSANKTHEVQLYNNFPLNDAKGHLHSTPLVRPGTSVKKGQVVADTNFTRNGTLALGRNLTVGYVPMRGYNFEDSVVISESAAKKLSSEHLHKMDFAADERTVLNRDRFARQHLGKFSPDQLKKLGADGVIQVGQRVRPGDPLIAAMTPFDTKGRADIASLSRKMSNFHSDASLRWDGETEGEVVAVHKNERGLTVHVRSIEPMQVGDKLAGRFGNKGIVGLILPDHEMPHTKEGKPIDVALNPSGIPGRMNIGQVLETASAKLVKKTGKPVIVDNFRAGTDMLEKVKKELHKHGLSDSEELFDPATKKSLGKALVGPQYMLKLVHQVDKKVNVRAGMTLPGQSPEAYDQNLQPQGGGGVGGQSVGNLGLYALLAHGSTATIREMQTFKSEGRDPQPDPNKAWKSQHADVWKAIQTGMPLPTPKPTFAFHKFTTMLKGAGINMEKRGNEFVLTPLTDRHILDMASEGSLDSKPRLIPSPAKVVSATKFDHLGNPRPEAGGLFDEKLTGGHGGQKFSALKLSEPVPNPVFELPIRHVTGLSAQDFKDIVYGRKFVTLGGNIVENGGKEAVTGGAGIKALLDRVDVTKELEHAKKALAKAPLSKVDPLLKKVKYLGALEKSGMRPSEAYILNYIPIVPPSVRPIQTLPTGSLHISDVNELYKQFGQVNEKLSRRIPYTKDLEQKLRQDLYDGVAAIAGLGSRYELAKHKGLIHQISGSTAKQGFFQDVVLNKKQDLTMRSTIVPEPALDLDEIGLPRHSALKLFAPFVVQKLQAMGSAKSVLSAQELISKSLNGQVKDATVWQALERVAAERPVLMKRDPALHKYSVQGFKPRIVEGSAIKIHPLVVGGFNADFDGDTTAVFVPVHRDAVEEARRMMPSNNLLSEATGQVMYQPTLESALGIFKLSLTGKETTHKFQHPGHLIDAAHQGKVKLNDVVHLEGKKTTAGRVLLAAALPEPLQNKVMHNLDFQIDKSGLNTLLSSLAKNHRGEFGASVNRLKDLGNDASFGLVRVPPLDNGHRLMFSNKLPAASIDPKKVMQIPLGTHSLTLEDFSPDREVRSKVISETQKKIREFSHLPTQEREAKEIQAWQSAEKRMKDLHFEKLKENPDNLFLMLQAGVKPGWSQYKQMKLAPLLFQDSMGRTIPTPITKSYAEGLDLADYWLQMHGARRGTVRKVQEVRDPGYMSKLLMNNMMDTLIASPDCGTKSGIAMSVQDPEIHDRYLMKPFSAGRVHFSAGTLITPGVTDQIRAVAKNAQLVVRSPLKCEHEKGICQKCAGRASSGQDYSIGTNIGVQSAHALGERAVQLTLKEFHTGGTAGGAGKLLNSFARFDKLMRLPKKVADEATLSMHTGKVEKIETDPTGVKIWVNGAAHHVGRDAQGNPLHQAFPGTTGSWTPPKVGERVEAGQPLSDPARTFVNPHHLYQATKSIDRVQNFMTDEVYKLYKDEGVKRRHVETVIRNMGNLARVHDPGDHPDVLRGEFRPVSSLSKLNRELTAKGKKPVAFEPVLKGINMLPLEMQEDWMARLNHERLKGTLLHSAAIGAASNLHGMHPIPAVAFGAEMGVRPPGTGSVGY